nr:MAG TPA: head tail connector [Caudoviricetes sp.]DAH30943.1 MAG TPA: head tail connector [Caudoviricetes sp.]DAQ12001.1 MAG TPA: head tail connector [Caudoviricetes sp.]DAQ62605.1 MAG TPA: head tail connector [Caudoviricetes sp.]
MEVSKVSDITADSVSEYLRLDEVSEEEKNTLTMLISVATSFIKSYTGLDDDGVDKYSEFVIVALILCQDMWDNRTMYVDSKDLNNTVQSILAMHSVNLL